VETEPTPHPSASISPIQPAHTPPLRRINSLLLPINYPDTFYTAAASPTPQNFSRVILWSDPSSEPKVIGGIITRLDPLPQTRDLDAQKENGNIQAQKAGNGEGSGEGQGGGEYALYIQSLTLLSPYRSLGLASSCLNSLITSATSSHLPKIVEIYAHVWTENREALSWYEKRGFVREGEVVAGYYKRLSPGGAWILRRRLKTSDHFQSGSGFTQKAAPALVVGSGEGRLGSNDAPPTPSTPVERPGNTLQHTKSFQDRRPDREWNDLPEDVLKNGGGLKPGSAVGSVASSRSSSRSGLGDGGSGRGGKKKRVYPAAAFGT